MPSQTKESPRLLIKEMMTRNVETISPTASIQEAAQQMKRLNVGAIPVCDGTRLQGC
jgi:CBS domain-containing protein